jgi:hypothetical protein
MLTEADSASTLTRILTKPRTDDERLLRRRLERFVRDLIREEVF